MCPKTLISDINETYINYEGKSKPCTTTWNLSEDQLLKYINTGDINIYGLQCTGPTSLHLLIKYIYYAPEFTTEWHRSYINKYNNICDNIMTKYYNSIVKILNNDFYNYDFESDINKIQTLSSRRVYTREQEKSILLKMSTYKHMIKINKQEIVNSDSNEYFEFQIKDLINQKIPEFFIELFLSQFVKIWDLIKANYSTDFCNHINKKIIKLNKINKSLFELIQENEDKFIKYYNDSNQKEISELENRLEINKNKLTDECNEKIKNLIKDTERNINYLKNL